VAELHDEAVRLHRRRRDELLQIEEYRTMRETLLAASPYPPAEEKLMRELGLMPPLPDARAAATEAR
jgi:hypothetical protein